TTSLSFADPATSDIYTLSLHDALPISQFGLVAEDVEKINPDLVVRDNEGNTYSVRYDQVNAMLLNEFLKEHRKVEEQGATITQRSEEHTSELQSLAYLVCRLLLEKKKQ